MLPTRLLRCLLLGLPLVAACAAKPPVAAQGLALRRVVVYRNGVGYFERGGVVTAERVAFQVKARHVGDFLATFAVMERGGSSVRAASFPIEAPRPRGAEPPIGPAGPEVMPPRPPRPKDPERLETVVMGLDGKRHELDVGYVVETPVWRPSYRLVIQGAEARLQAWAIVQNISGEPWISVRLSLVAEAPLAFQASLGTPVVPPRPTVNDTGDIIAVIPQTETTLEQAAPAPPPPPPEAAPPASAAPEEEQDRAAEPRAKKVAPRRRAAAPPPPAPFAAAPAMRPAAPSRPRNLSALAALAVEGGTTRYDVPQPVTVPNESATMVMLLDRDIPGESVFLYAPDPGIPVSQSQPFRVARFTNKTGGMLERGPIAIFSEGAFLGQGMIDPLPDGATATVPFSLERSLAVERSSESHQEGARLHKIEASDLSVERESVTRTRYRIRNGGERRAKVRVKHPRQGGATLHEPPPGTEDNVGAGSALVPFEVAPRATAEVVVDERQRFFTSIDWLSGLADDAVKAYWARPDARADVVAALKTAWQVRETLVRGTDELQKLDQEQQGLQAATEETRENLRAIAKNRSAGDLRKKLTERLARDAARLDAVTKRLVEVRVTVAEAQVRFREAIRDIRLLPGG